MKKTFKVIAVIAVLLIVFGGVSRVMKIAGHIDPPNPKSIFVATHIDPQILSKL